MTFKQYRWRVRRRKPVFFYDFNFVKCDVCNHEWLGVYQIESKKIKCENCLEMRYFTILEEEEEFDTDE